MSKDNNEEVEYKAIDFTLLKRLMVFLKPYMKFVVIALVVSITASALGPLRPYLSKIAIDDYLSKSNFNGLLTITGMIFALLIVHSLLQFTLVYVMQWVGQKVLNDIRKKIFRHIHGLSLRFYDKTPVGRLVTRVTNDVEGLNEMFSSGVVMIIADVLLIFWIVAFMFYTNWKLALFTLAILPFLFIAASIFRKKVRVLFRDIRLKVSEMNSFLSEFISGITTVRLFTQEKNLNKKFDSINEQHTALWVKSVFYYATFFPVVEMLSAITLGVILWYTAGNILSGAMTIGTLIAFTQYAEMFFRPIRDLTEKYTTMQSAMAASERIFGLLDTTSTLDDHEDAVEMKPLEQSIEFNHVNFSYDESKQVLKDVSFEIKKGDTIAIVGATGAGKTSIINLLCRFYEHQSGDILVDGIDIRKIKQESLRTKIALVMQDVFLFSRTIAENISLGDESISRERMKEVAKALGSSDFIERLNDGYDSQLTERGLTLSSGQRQLLAFCRAYAADPDILILDEATSNIDSETEMLIEKALEKLLTDRTSIVIAHRLSTIKRANKIVVLHKGRVREIGNHKELIELDGIYAKLYKLQYNGKGTAA